MVFFPPSDINKNIQEIDTIIIGSDWVWHLPDKELDLSLSSLSEYKQILLGNIPSIQNNPSKRIISYAASQGIIPNKYSPALRQAIDNFDAISVREKESIQYFKKIIKYDGPILQVADPTLLISKRDLEGVESKIQINGHYIAVYCLPCQNPQDIQSYIHTIQIQTGLPVMILNKSSEFHCHGSEIGDTIGPGEWLSYIKNASYLITNSFHGMVFAITYRRAFTAFYRQKNDFRQENLVHQLGLEERLLHPNASSIDPFTLEIDWSKVEKKIKQDLPTNL